MEVEFIAQTLQLIHAACHPGICHPNTRAALAALRDAGLLPPEDAALLIRADRIWRAMQGMLRLTLGRPTAEAPPDAAMPALRRPPRWRAAGLTCLASCHAGLAGRRGAPAVRPSRGRAGGKCMSVQEGDKAPDFEMPASGGRTVSLKAMKGSPFVLYFYPKADTPGCTKEACAFQEALPQLGHVGIDVIGVSKDPLRPIEKFAEKYKLTFPLASDESAGVAEAYGTWVREDRCMEASIWAWSAARS